MSSQKFIDIYMHIYSITTNLVYFLFKILPTNKNKILFLSRQTNKPSIDFRMLKDEILKQDSDKKIVFITKRIEKNIKDVILKNTLLIFRQMYHLATSSICIIDGYSIPVSILKHKKSLKIVQIWHSLGAVKKFGYQSLNTDKKIAISKGMKMHKNYDLIISSSKEMIKYFSKAFDYKKNKFVVCGLPRIDYLLTKTDINRNKIYQKYSELKNKKVILYAPTFRDYDNYKIDELIDSIDTNKYILIIKTHSKINCKINLKEGVYLCPEFTTLQLLSIANYCITDYSAVSLESAILNIPTYIYAYDLDEYKKYPGLNVNLEKEFEGYVFKDAKELYRKLSSEKYNINIVKRYCKKYIDNTSKNVTINLAKLILERGDDCV